MGGGQSGGSVTEGQEKKKGIRRNETGKRRTVSQVSQGKVGENILGK